ncbi:uncharacterized protein METZ01_LOCUS162565 [marine metagenome]|uniref:Uncharacterized protein n=1 Tax=marine metagenome TaxID=408172 RepID=A0A382B867_9ZZZZ
MIKKAVDMIWQHIDADRNDPET